GRRRRGIVRARRRAAARVGDKSDDRGRATRRRGGRAADVEAAVNLRIGTRKSALALWQAERVEAWLRERGHACELLLIFTEGDRKGLFVKDLEQALADRRADLAVHSAKDVPFAISDAFVLSAFCAREDPRDALVAPFAKRFANLPRGARVGTSALRRAVQLL